MSRKIDQGRTETQANRGTTPRRDNGRAAATEARIRARHQAPVAQTAEAQPASQAEPQATRKTRKSRFHRITLNMPTEKQLMDGLGKVLSASAATARVIQAVAPVAETAANHIDQAQNPTVKSTLKVVRGHVGGVVHQAYVAPVAKHGLLGVIMDANDRERAAAKAARQAKKNPTAPVWPVDAATAARAQEVTASVRPATRTANAEDDVNVTPIRDRRTSRNRAPSDEEARTIIKAAKKTGILGALTGKRAA